MSRQPSRNEASPEASWKRSARVSPSSAARGTRPDSVAMPSATSASRPGMSTASPASSTWPSATLAMGTPARRRIAFASTSSPLARGRVRVPEITALPCRRPVAV